MAGLTLHILNILLIGMKIAIPHDFRAGVAVHAIKRVFALSKLCNRLIVIINAFCRSVSPFHKSHCPQVVVTTVMAGIALSIGNRSCEFVLFG